MYLEIAPRQVGKTTRLAYAVAEHLYTTNDTVYVLTHNSKMVDHMKKMVASHINGTPRPYNIGCTWYYRGIVTENTKLFVDEFDFLEINMQDNLRSPEFRGLLQNGYFTTTPMFIRRKKDLLKEDTTDLLVKLLQMNNHKYNMIMAHRPYRTIDTVNAVAMGRRSNELFGAFSE